MIPFSGRDLLQIMPDFSTRCNTFQKEFPACVNEYCFILFSVYFALHSSFFSFKKLYNISEFSQCLHQETHEVYIRLIWDMCKWQKICPGAHLFRKGREGKAGMALAFYWCFGSSAYSRHFTASSFESQVDFLFLKGCVKVDSIHFSVLSLQLRAEHLTAQLMLSDFVSVF